MPNLAASCDSPQQKSDNSVKRFKELMGFLANTTLALTTPDKGEQKRWMDWIKAQLIAGRTA